MIANVPVTPEPDSFLATGPEIVLLVAGVALTLTLLGVFIYVFSRKEHDEGTGSPFSQ